MENLVWEMMEDTGRLGVPKNSFLINVFKENCDISFFCNNKAVAIANSLALHIEYECAPVGMTNKTIDNVESFVFPVDNNQRPKFIKLKQTSSDPLDLVAFFFEQDMIRVVFSSDFDYRIRGFVKKSTHHELDGKKEILISDLLGASETTICVRENSQPFSPSDVRIDNMIYVNSINITNSGNLSIRETRVNGPSFQPITPPENFAAGNESDDGGKEQEQHLSATVPVQNSESNQVQCSSMVVNAVDSAIASTSSSTVPQFNQYCWRYRKEGRILFPAAESGFVNHFPAENRIPNKQHYMKTWLANNESNEPSSVQTTADSESSDTSSEECDDVEEDEVPKTPDPYTNDGSARQNKLFRCNICKSYLKTHYGLKRHKVKVHQESYEYHQSKSQDEFSCPCGKSFKHSSSLSRHKESCKKPKMSRAKRKSRK